jgi:hypothetical protein
MSYGLKQYLHWNTFTLRNGWQYLTQWDVHNYILDEKVNKSFSGSFLAMDDNIWPNEMYIITY